MAMTPLYRGSVGLAVPVGPRSREGRNRSHDDTHRIAPSEEVVAKARRGALAGGAQQGGKPAAAGLETALGLGHLEEGGLDGGARHGVRDALLGQLLAETAAAYPPA